MLALLPRSEEEEERLSDGPVDFSQTCEQNAGESVAKGFLVSPAVEIQSWNQVILWTHNPKLQKTS